MAGWEPEIYEACDYEMQSSYVEHPQDQKYIIISGQIPLWNTCGKFGDSTLGLWEWPTNWGNGHAYKKGPRNSKYGCKIDFT